MELCPMRSNPPLVAKLAFPILLMPMLTLASLVAVCHPGAVGVGVGVGTGSET